MVVVKLGFAHNVFHNQPDASMSACRPTLKWMFSVGPAQVCVVSQELFAHLPSSVMAHANMNRESQSQVPELSALQAPSKDILKQSVETRGILDALCKVLMDSGLVQKEKLLAEAHRLSFAAVRRTHPCCWNLSLECVFRSRDVAFKIASCFVNKKDCLGLRTASKAFATCMAEVSSAMVQPKVLVWRGDDSAADVFDPVSKTWDTFPSTHQCRMVAASAVINGRLYVCGGHSGGEDPPSAALDCFDPCQGIWQALPRMSQRRCGQSVAVVGARLHVCGGACGRRAPIRRMLRHAEQYVAVTSSHVSSAQKSRSRSDQEARIHRRWRFR